MIKLRLSLITVIYGCSLKSVINKDDGWPLVKQNTNKKRRPKCGRITATYIVNIYNHSSYNVSIDPGIMEQYDKHFEEHYEIMVQCISVCGHAGSSLFAIII